MGLHNLERCQHIESALSPSDAPGRVRRTNFNECVFPRQYFLRVCFRRVWQVIRFSGARGGCASRQPD